MAERAGWLEPNLALLARRQPLLADSIRQSQPDSRVVSLPARDGGTIPAVQEAGRTVPLHSRYDPRQEGSRFADSFRGCGCRVVLGLGGGFHIEPMLDDDALQALLVVEKGRAVLRSLLDLADFSRILADPRVTILSGPEGIPAALTLAWKPPLAGAMRSAPLRAWCDLEPEFCQTASANLQSAVESVRADYSVQSHFGKRWLVNILHNLPLLRPAPALPTIRSAAITAAGPSLDAQITQLQGSEAGSLLVATDTSLPALLGRGIHPDAVISIDCQVYGYHHFLKGLPLETTLYLDLASPRALGRRSASPVFIASGHPLARFIDSHWLPLPWVDTSGGNVTHAAVALARALGASAITVYGADFSYPGAKAYARGTYLYDHFRASQDRLAPAESSLVSFAFANVVFRTAGGRRVPTTELMIAYRDRLQRLVRSIDARVSVAAGTGLPLDPVDCRPQSAHAPLWPSQGPVAPKTWRQFLSSYREQVEALPARCSAPQELELRDTLLPVAARVVKEGIRPGDPALAEARRWTLERIDRSLRQE